MPKDRDRLIRGSVIVRGVYEHYKSTREKRMRYVVLEVVGPPEAGEYAVKYMAVYPSAMGKRFTRPLISREDGFLLPVRNSPEAPRYIGPRFTFIGTLTERELALYLKQYPPETK